MRRSRVVGFRNDDAVSCEVSARGKRCALAQVVGVSSTFTLSPVRMRM